MVFLFPKVGYGLVPWVSPNPQGGILMKIFGVNWGCRIQDCHPGGLFGGKLTG